MYGHTLHLFLSKVGLCLDAEMPWPNSWLAEAIKYSLAMHFFLLAGTLHAPNKHPQIDHECEV